MLITKRAEKSNDLLFVSGLFELHSCGTSIIRIKNVHSGLYIAINKAGQVYTTRVSKFSAPTFQSYYIRTRFENAIFFGA